MFDAVTRALPGTGDGAMSMTSPAAEPNTFTRSPPPRPSIASRSLPCSARRMRTSAARPSTAIAPEAEVTLISSAPAVPLAVMVSGCPSPAPPPRTPSRSMFASTTSVPVRSLTTALSAPPSASRSTRSTLSVSIVMLPRLRKKRRRLPLAEKSKFSLPPEPLKRSVSVPPCPSTTSLPSPGSQTNVSWPVPRRPMSAPPLPSTRSFCAPPRNVSAPAPPSSVS